MRIFGIAALMFALGLTSASGKDRVELDQLLHGFDDRCRFTSEFERMHRSITTPEEFSGSTWIPGWLRPYAGDLQQRVIDGYIYFSLPVHGIWKGVTVSALERIAMDESGVAIFSIVFDDDPTVIWRVFGKAAERSSRELAIDPNNDVGSITYLRFSDGAVKFTCDHST